jgi:hypothetical protein
MVLQPITMPIKNFSPPLLTPACSPYQFLYHSHKTPPCSKATGMLLNCNSNSLTGTLLNCKSDYRAIHCFMDALYPIPPSSGSLFSIPLNCRTLWMHNGMSSSLCGHLSHLSHLGYLSHLGHLNTLNPYSSEPLDTILPDSYHRAFITEMLHSHIGTA